MNSRLGVARALLAKPERREIDVAVRYTGFEIPNRFVAQRRVLPRRRIEVEPDAVAVLA